MTFCPNNQVADGFRIRSMVDLCQASLVLEGKPVPHNLAALIKAALSTLIDAAGVASALAVQDGCLCRDVEIPKLQKRLKEQGAYLG